MKRILGCAPWAAVGLGFAGVSIDSEPGECALPSRLSRLVALLLADVAVTFCASAEHLLRVVVAGVYIELGLWQALARRCECHPAGPWKHR